MVLGVGVGDPQPLISSDFTEKHRLDVQENAVVLGIIL